MLKFESERIHTYKFKSNIFKQPIPIACVEPKNKTDDSVVFVYCGGIGSSIPSCLYMNNFIYDNHYFVTYEKAGHNDNLNKPSQYKKPYLKELDVIVDWVKKQMPERKIYLLGESWGTSIIFLYYKKNKDKVNGAVGWNMPFTIVNPERKTPKQMYSIIWREVLTFLFNVECHLPVVQAGQDKFSQNKLFARLLMLVPPSKTNTKINLSVWRTMRPAYRFVKKYGRNIDYKFLYIQSGQDIMAKWKKVAKIEKCVDNHHYVKFPTGYHVLSMEPKESVDLYNKVLEFINN